MGKTNDISSNLIPPPMAIECLHCGKCCTELGQIQMIVSSNDIRRWIEEGEWDILERVNLCFGITHRFHSCFDKILMDNDLKQCRICHGGDVYNEAKTSTRCVFLKKTRNKNEYKCSIEETKPDHCRSWEVGWHVNCPQNHLNPLPDDI